MPGLPSWLSGTQNALKGKANNVIGKTIGNIKSPLLRGAAGQLLDGLFPGLGGGTPDFTDNVFRQAAQDRIKTVIAATNDIAANVQVISTASDNMSQNFDWRATLRPKKCGKWIFYRKKRKDY